MQYDRTGALSTLQNQYVIDIDTVDMGGGKSSCDVIKDKSPTLCTTHYGEPAVVYDARGNGDGDTVPTMTGDHNNRITDYTGIVVCMNRESVNDCKSFGKTLGIHEDGIQPTLVSMGQGEVAYAVDCRNATINPDINGTLQAKENGGFNLNSNNVVMCVQRYTYAMNAFGSYKESDKTSGIKQRDYKDATDLIVISDNMKVRYIVRRLTPLECTRLQGFPDGWVDIETFVDSKGKQRKASDSHKYKALGNSIALPSWRWVIKRICANYERPATMASLFDGIGGFPLIWEQVNGKGTCLWSSEIEDFPIAVTKERFI